MFLLAIVVGLPSIEGGLIRDDRLYLTRNPHVTDPVGPMILLTAPLWPYEDLGLYRPLATASFRFDWLVSDVSEGHAPMAHLHNLILNGAAALLLAVLLSRLGFRPVHAVLGAALFGVHPARSEAFLWISGRAECLMTVCALWSLVVLSRGASARRLIVAGSLASAAILAKEQGAALVVLAPLLPGLVGRDRVRVAVVMAVAVLPWIGMRWSVLGAMGPTGIQAALPGASWGEMCVYAAGWLGRYGLLLIWPLPLRHEYDEPGGADPVGIVAAVVLLGLAAWSLRRPSPWGFAGALFLLPLIPALNLMARGSETFAERFLCLPAAGAVVWLLCAIRPVRPLAGVALLSGLVALATVQTGFRAGEYADEATLFASQRRGAPRGGAGGGGGGGGQLANRAGDREGAQEALRAAVARSPGEYRWRLELARVLGAAGELQEAQAELHGVIEGWPMIGPAWADLGRLRLAGGNRVGAEHALRRALQLEPRDWRAGRDLWQLLNSLGRPAEAQEVLRRVVASLEEAARARPWDFQPLVSAGRLLVTAGQREPGLLLYRRAMDRVIRDRDRDALFRLVKEAGG